MAEAVLKQPQKVLLWVADEDCQKRFNPAMTEQIIKDGYSFRADTLEGLAKILKEKFNMPEDVFLKSIAEYNEMVKKGKDEAFGKKPANLKPIEKPPFYASPTQAGVHHTMAGCAPRARPDRCSTGTGRSSPAVRRGRGDRRRPRNEPPGRQRHDRLPACSAA
jgi:hypothetical protein